MTSARVTQLPVEIIYRRTGIQKAKVTQLPVEFVYRKSGDQKAKITQLPVELVYRKSGDQKAKATQIACEIVIASSTLAKITAAQVFSAVLDVLWEPVPEARVYGLDIDSSSVNEAVIVESIVIDNGDQQTTVVSAVLSLTFRPARTVMRFKNEDNPWGPWQPVADTFSWALSAGASGDKTVSAQFADSESGPFSEVCSDTINLFVPAYAQRTVHTFIERY